MTVSHELLQQIMAEAKEKILDCSASASTEEVLQMIEETALNCQENLELSQYKELIGIVYARLRCKLGILQRYLEEEGVNEIMVNGKDHFFIEDGRGMRRLDSAFGSTEELEEIVRNIASDVHREINEMHPILDARLADGSRVNAVYKNIAAGGPVITIRRFSKERITIAEMIQAKTLTQDCAEVLSALVECGYNIFVSGGTSSGKTTFLNALSDFVPRDERVIVIEDSTELQLNNIANLVQMECRNANSLGQGEITMEMLIKTSLRMRPDRIIVGEVRGKEVASMLQGMNTGHDGSMSTGHGNSVAGMLRRLEAMYLMSAQIPMDAIRAQIVEGIDLMVHLGRLPGGRRKVLEIQELIDFQDGRYVLNPLFVLDETQNLICTGNKLINRSKLQVKGFEHDRRLRCI